MKILSPKTLLLMLFVLSLSMVYSQVDKKVLNWYNTKKYGMSTDKAYKYKYIRKNDPDTVVVAIIDSGIDIEHEDLEGKIWVNKDEIPDNGVDDDNNGFIDDIHGWNFLGSKDGKNQEFARLEMTRIYARLIPKFEEMDSTEAVTNHKEDYELYLEVKKEVEKNKKRYQMIGEQYKVLVTMEDTIRKKVAELVGKEDFKLKDLEKFETDDPNEKQLLSMGELIAKGEFESFFESRLEGIEARVKYYYNPDYDDRANVGDNYLDIKDIDYGNKDAEGPSAKHGTHVGGIVAAIRGNKLGGDGVADNVVLMSLRAVPDGDETDKDVARAIRYAVDNGAQIINGSFGKQYSQLPEIVYDAIRYAEEHDVLYVDAAGNSGENLDTYPSYPRSMFPFQKEPFNNYLSIGASTREHEEKLAATFSNYSSTLVDVFAPGYEIYNTVPGNKYHKLNGTSMAAPMVTGVAAFLKGYFPKLTMIEIRQIILDSAIDFSDTDQIKPGTKDEKVKFGTLSKTGSVVNLLEAVKLAEKRYEEKGYMED